MRPPAQTNVQLFNQLADRDYGPADIEAVRDGYVLAIRLFSGCYRSSGKTFIAHAIGTASVLAELRAPGYVVAAGLLHSAYTLGEFGTLRRAIDARKRRRVATAVGRRAEELVGAYAGFDWSEDHVRGLLASESPPAGRLRDVVLLRLANEVDEYAELAAWYAPSWEARVARARSFLPLCAELAERIGEPELAGALCCVREQTLSESSPRSTTVASPASSLVPPASHVARPHVLVRALSDGLRARFRRG